MPITLRAGGFTNKGGYRDSNEDAVAVVDYPDALVCVVADGLGGADVGRLASERAVETLIESVAKTGRDRLGMVGVEDSLRRAFRLAHDRVRGIEPQPHHAACCATMLYWPRHRLTAWIAQLGDTAAERLRGGRIERMTALHDLVGVMATQHGVSYEEMRSRGRWRNVLCYFLGMLEEFRGAAVTAVPLALGDRFLLTSDGVWPVIENSDKESLLCSAGSPRERAERLCRVALENGSRDNVSAVVIDVE